MALILDATPDELKVFLEEAEEQIQLLDEDIVRMEKEQDNQDLLQEIFRAAHTLKGSSAALGHTKMAELTHGMESLLDRLRKHTLCVTSPLIDILLEGLDAIRVLKEEVVSLEDSGADFSALTERLRHAAKTWPADGIPADNAALGSAGQAAELLAHGTTAPTPMIPAVETSVAAAGSVYTIEVSLDPESELRAARCFQVYLELARYGAILSAQPSVEDIEAERVGANLTLVLSSNEDPTHLQKLAASVGDVLAVQVIPGETTGHAPSGPVATAPALPTPPTATNEVNIRAGDVTTLSAVSLATQPSPEPSSVPASDERRVIDLGAEARGKPADDQVKMAANKLAKLSNTVRIDVERLDALLNLVGELVIDRTRLVQLSSDLHGQFSDNPSVEALIEATAHIGRIADELQEQIMKGRMLPVETVFNKMPRVVRDVARNCGKDIDFQMSGQDTELDRSVIEAIGDPLIHLLRNSVDHGVETPERRRAVGKPERGVVRLAASHAENNILITIEDDGAGIDGTVLKTLAVEKGLISPEAAALLTEREAIDLIFLPGFSTAKKLTDVSGRGVGMDIVRANIEKLNGSISIRTAKGVGTTFSIRLPLTLAIIQALLVTLRNQIYAIPLSAVTEVLPFEKSAVQMINKTEAVLLRGQVLSLLRLDRLLKLPKPDPILDAAPVLVTAASGTQSAGHTAVGVLDREPAMQERASATTQTDRLAVIAVRAHDQQVGLVVDGLIGEQDIVIKSLGTFLGDLPGLAGSTILGDGRIALILDVASLVSSVGHR